MLMKGGVKKMKKDTRKRYTLRIPNDLYEQIKKEAREYGIAVNAFIITVLKDYLLETE